MLPFQFLVQILNIFLLIFLTQSVQSQECTSVSEYHEIDTLTNYVRINQHQKAQTYGDELIKKLDKKNYLNCEIAHWVYLAKGELFEFSEEIHLAIEQYHKITPVAIQNNWHKLLVETYMSLSRSHERRGRAVDSKRYLDDALTLIEKHGIEESLSRLYMRSSSHYRMYGNRPDTALYLAQKAVDLGIKYNKPRSVTDGYMLLGMIETDKLKRIAYYQKGRDAFLEEKVYHGAAIMNSSVAGLYMELGKYEEALKSLSRSLEIEDRHVAFTGIKEPTHFLQMQKIYGIKSRIFNEINQQDSAKYYAELAQSYRDRITNNTNEQKISQVEIKAAIENEKIKTQSVNEQLQKSRTFSGITLIMLAVMNGLLLIIYRNRQELKQKNKTISEQIDELSVLNNRQELLLSEVHHRVKNNLQNVISLLILKERGIEDVHAKKELTDISNKIYSIALIHEQLYRDSNFENINMKDYMLELADHHKSFQHKENELNIEVESEDIALNVETSIPLGLICSELITNSIKYDTRTKKLKINISMVKISHDRYKLTYRDNGIGYSENALNNKTNGLGMKLIKSMGRQLLADIKLSNQQGAKTEIEFEPKKLSRI